MEDVHWPGYSLVRVRKTLTEMSSSIFQVACRSVARTDQHFLALERIRLAEEE